MNNTSFLKCLVLFTTLTTCSLWAHANSNLALEEYWRQHRANQIRQSLSSPNLQSGSNRAPIPTAAASALRTNLSPLGGSNGGGGGDMESEFKEIALNISQWIRSGRSAALTLPSEITADKYRNAMIQELQSFSIEMVARPVFFGGTEKTCVSARVPAIQQIRSSSPVRNKIICNQDLFRQTYTNNINGAFRLVHHEFAGLAGVERNQGQDSDYRVSDQISKYLREQRIYRLPVSEFSARTPTELKTFSCNEMEVVQTYIETGSDHLYDEKGRFAGQIAPEDLVYTLAKDPSSPLGKLLNEYKLKNDPQEDYFIGDTVNIGSGGRVESGYVLYLVSILAAGKRWQEVIAQVKVKFSYSAIGFEGAVLAYTPNAEVMTMTSVEGIVSVVNDFPAQVFHGDVPFEKMTNQTCRNVSIPKIPENDRSI